MPLNKRMLPNPGFALTELAIGGAQFGNHPTPMPLEVALATIKSAWDSGIRVFDTAPLYGYGLSETILGKALNVYPREELIISTKVGRVLVYDDSPKVNDIFPESLPYRADFDYSYAGIIRSVEESLERLQTTYLDIVHIHDLDKLTHGEDYPQMLASFLQPDASGKTGYHALLELREKGTIKAIGTGMNTCDGILNLINQTPPGFFDVIMLAGRYTLLEQTALKELFPACAKRNIKLMIAGPLNSGILSSDPNNHYYNYRAAPEDIIERKNEIEAVCLRYNVSLRHAALQFLLLNSHVASIVSGMRNPTEIQQNIESLRQPVPRELWSELMARGYIDPNSFVDFFHDSNLSTQPKHTAGLFSISKPSEDQPEEEKKEATYSP